MNLPSLSTTKPDIHHCNQEIKCNAPIKAVTFIARAKQETGEGGSAAWWLGRWI